MSEYSSKKKAILKELNKYNKSARKFLKLCSFDYSQAYNELQTTDTWVKAKALLIEYNSLSGEPFECPHCYEALDPYSATMHHTIYDHKRMFDPLNISFMHNNCHYQHHLDWGVPGGRRHTKAYFGYRGIRIYSPLMGKIYIRYEIIVLVIVLLGILISYLLSI